MHRNASRRKSLRFRALGVFVLAAAGLLLSPVSAQADPVSDAEKELDQQYEDLEKVIEDYNALRIEFDETKDKIEDLEKKLKPFEEKLDVLYERVGDIAASVYMGGDLTSVSAVFTTGTPDTLADRITMLDQATVSDNEAIKELNEAKADLDERKAVLDELYDTQSAQNEELKSAKEDIQKDIDRLQGERERAYRDSRGLSDDAFVPDYVGGARGDVMRFALAQEGEPYVFGAAGPDAWDCSGFTMMAWAQVGVSLPHNAAAQWNMMTHISREQLTYGDLVFYNGLSHVGMYIGDGHVIHAATNYYNVYITTIDAAASSYYGSARVPGW